MPEKPDRKGRLKLRAATSSGTIKIETSSEMVVVREA